MHRWIVLRRYHVNSIHCIQRHRCCYQRNAPSSMEISCLHQVWYHFYAFRSTTGYVVPNISISIIFVDVESCFQFSGRNFTHQSFIRLRAGPYTAYDMRKLSPIVLCSKNCYSHHTIKTQYESIEIGRSCCVPGA